MAAVFIVGLEADVTVAPPGLGLAKGDGGVAEQVVRLVALVGRDADACRDRQRDVVEAFERKGSFKASSSLSASSSGPPESDSPSARMANSSPLGRPIVSQARSTPMRRPATAFKSSSPASWPRLLVDGPEVVQVDEEGGDEVVVALGAQAGSAGAGRG